MHDFPNESYNRAPVLFMDITYQDSIPLQEALDSMERITYRYRSNK